MKKSNIIIGTIIALSIIVLTYGYLNISNKNVNKNNISSNLEILKGKEITLYKSPSCGCCKGYAQALEKAGAKVNIVSDAVMNQKIKAKYNIPENKQSCHTSVIDGYFVEGHVPLKSLAKFLNEKPNVKGITLPGMPSGTPGMPGAKTQIYNIEALTNEGKFISYEKY